ncbi:MAG: hypothetical protein JWN70_6656 [Planctomycetaceae bacterium]|nr:hypothetical protein [Planctomycetaceae bacterium]
MRTGSTNRTKDTTVIPWPGSDLTRTRPLPILTDLAVGPGPVGAGPPVLYVRSQGRGEGPGAVAGSVVGQHCLHRDSAGGEERCRAEPEGGGFFRLVVEDFRVRQTRVVIDGVVQVGVPGPFPAVPSSRGPSEGAVSAAVRDASELLDVHVDRVSRMVVLVPLRCGLAHGQAGALVQPGQWIP